MTKRTGSALVLALALAACSKQQEKKPERTEPWANPSYRATTAASSAPALPRADGDGEEHTRYVLDTEKSSARFSLLAKEQTVRGSLGLERGELAFTRRGLDTPVSGTLVADLTSVVIEGDAEAGASPFTARALEWLELGSLVSRDVRERHRRALVEITEASIEIPSTGHIPRTRKVTTRGQLSLHGFRVPFELLVEAEFGSPEDPDSKQDTVRVRSRRPLVIKLAEHDIQPRNAEGHLVAEELPLLGKRIGREARVEFELFFTAAGAKKNIE